MILDGEIEVEGEDGRAEAAAELATQLVCFFSRVVKTAAKAEGEGERRGRRERENCCNERDRIEHVNRVDLFTCRRLAFLDLCADRWSEQ